MKTRTLVACAVVLLASTAVWAQAGPAETGRAEATRIFRMLMSPFCPGLTLADCPSTNAFTLRDEIRDRLVQGESADAVVSDLVNRYGTTILADPSGTPTGRMLVGIPLSLSSLGGLAVILYVRRRLRSSEPEVSSVAATDWKLQQRLDDELDELD